jgi:DNA-binding MarR family transcriptional regulator
VVVQEPPAAAGLANTSALRLAADGEDASLVEAARQLQTLIMAGERYRVALAEATGLGTTEVQAIGYLLLHGTRGPTELARDLAMTTSATTALVDRLERHGVAERVRHPDDRRRLLVRLTTAGLDTAARCEQPLLVTVSLVGSGDLGPLTSWLETLANQLLQASSRDRPASPRAGRGQTG